MTDERYVSDLEAIGQTIPSIPSDYSTLRALLDSLPPPTPPDIRSARSGVTAQASGAGGVGGELTLQSSTPIGSESGISEGVSQAPTLGLRNMFADPRLFSIPTTSIAPGALVNFGREWRVTFAAGTTGATCTAFKSQADNNSVNNPFQSATMLGRVTSWTAAGTAVLTFQADRQGPFAAASYDATVLPYVVFSADIFKDPSRNQQFNNVTSATIQLVLRNAGDTADLAVSTPIDYKNMTLGSYLRHSVAVASSNFSVGVIPVIRMTIVTSASGAGVNMHPEFSNPQLELSPYQSPTVFLASPRGSVVQIWGNASDEVLQVGDPSDTVGQSRVGLGLDASSNGAVFWGPGNATHDMQVARQVYAGKTHLAATDFNVTVGASVLATGYANTDAGRANVGIRTAGDTDYRAQLTTSTDNATASTGLIMGPGNANSDIRLYRSAAKVFTIDDRAGGAATLNVIGAIQQGGTAVSIAGHGAADHADITRAFMLYAEDCTLDGATLVNVGASPNLSRVVNYADAATSGAFWTFLVPNDWASGVINVQFCWTPAATDAVAHTVRWSMTVKQINTGADVTAAGTTTAFTGASAARTVNIMVVDTLTSTGITPAAAGSRMMIEVQRIGADAADTYVGAVRLHGVIVSYTANQ